MIETLYLKSKANIFLGGLILEKVRAEVRVFPLLQFTFNTFSNFRRSDLEIFGYPWAESDPQEFYFGQPYA